MSRATPRRGTKACPFCAERIQAAALLCRFCGRELPLAVTAAAPGPVLPAAVPGITADATLLHEAEILELLTSLVQKSLVVYEEDEQGRVNGCWNPEERRSFADDTGSSSWPSPSKQSRSCVGRNSVTGWNAWRPSGRTSGRRSIGAGPMPAAPRPSCD